VLVGKLSGHALWNDRILIDEQRNSDIHQRPSSLPDIGRQRATPSARRLIHLDPCPRVLRLLSIQEPPYKHNSRKPRMRVRQQFPHIGTPTRALVAIRKRLWLCKRAIRNSQSRPSGQRDRQLVRLEVRPDDLASESHIRFYRDEVERCAGKGRARGRLEHVPAVFWVKGRDGRAGGVSGDRAAMGGCCREVE
jgi:hypothetical protein